jgi:catechol O-methyltransferase
MRYFHGNCSQHEKNIADLKKVDLLFIDHWKAYYLSDFMIFKTLDVIKKGALVIGDNIICPGAPEYLSYFKKSTDFKSILYHSYLEYSTRPDAVLVSLKI